MTATKATATSALEQLAENVNAIPLLDVGRGNAPLKDEILGSLSEIIDSGRFIGGPFVKFLEESVAETAGAKFGVGCASGSDALLLAMMAIDLQPGDEVICPSFTFFATASAIHRLGGVPVFVDIEHDSFNVNVEQLESLISERTKAIIPVHLFGQCANMNPIMEIADRYDLAVIEDCAQSIGASLDGCGAGSIGSIGCFSFYPTKNLGGFGDGGMLTTNDAQLAERLRLLANHGMKPRYYHQEVGINSRLDAMQAAALCAKMKCVEDYSQRRQVNASRYQQMMSDAGLCEWLTVPQSSANQVHVWNQFTIRIPNGQRDSVRSFLAERNVGSEIYYPIPLHQQECFNYLCVDASTMVETERAAAEVLSLPIFPELTEAEQAYVVCCLVDARDACR
ncbi:MAG: DegT/DnrJ/EryC1/StrS family aminotransferase [Planctomycetota bacterium]